MLACTPLTSWPLLLVLSRVACTSASSQQHLGDWGCNAWVAGCLSRERPGLRLMQMLPPQVLALARQQNKQVKVVGRWPLALRRRLH